MELGARRTLIALVFVLFIMQFVHIKFDLVLFQRRTRVCACSRCLAAVPRDSWFMENYNKSVPVLLNKTNSQLNGDTTKWWMKLQRFRSKLNYSTAIESLFTIIPDVERYADAGPNRCRTCAVVGNSANLLGSHYGPLIDLNDIVIRMNRAPTKGFETDVGTKTTHRAIYPESAVDFDNSTHLILLPFKVLDLEWLINVFTSKKAIRTYKNIRGTIQVQKEKVLVLNPKFIKYIHTNWLRKQGHQPTSGFLMLMLALHICDQVDIYGFGKSRNGNWGHYFESTYKADLTNGPHRGNIEHNIILELAHSKVIQFYKGW